MRRFQSWIVAGVQLAIVFGMAANYQVAQVRLPRAWARTAPFDPDLPIRGRYVRLRVETQSNFEGFGGKAKLGVSPDGSLTATIDPEGTVPVNRIADNRTALSEPVAFFIPEHIPDPSLRPQGEELWVEVSVPESGPPRPIRLGVKKDGVLTPLHIN